MRGINVTLGAVLLVAAACGGSATAPSGETAAQVTAAAGDTVELGIGDVARISDSSIRIRFDGIAEDSRCPTDVVCVWQGDAHVRLAVTTSGPEWAVGLHTGIEPRQVVVAGFIIRLLDVSPAPVSDRTIRPDEYTIRLEFSRH
jgi:hypothetical protein